MHTFYKLGAVAAVCGVIFYATWHTGALPELEEEEDHSHEFVEFSPGKILEHGIDIAIAESGQLNQTVKAPARIVMSADNIAHVLPKASGIAVAANKNLGERVQKGEVLAVLDSKEVAEAKSSLLTALKTEELTSKTYQREKSLQEKNISSAQELNNAENAWESARIDTELAKQKLHALGLDQDQIDNLAQAAPTTLRSYEIRSPIDGQIISRHITIGEVVSAEQEVYVVADLSKVWAEVSIFSSDRPQVKQGQSIAITLPGVESAAEGKIVYLSPVIDQETRTSTAIAEIDNADGMWLPGSFAQGMLVVASPDVLIRVPREAIQNIDGKDALFVAENDGFAVKPISLGRRDDKYYEITSGVNPGDRYACKNTFLLKAELQKDEAEHMD